MGRENQVSLAQGDQGPRIKASLTLALAESKNVSRKTVKTGTNFTIRDIAQCMGDHTGKQFVYPTQKQGKYTTRKKRAPGHCL